MENKIYKLLTENNGYLQSSQLNERAEKYMLKKMLDSGKLEKVKHGLYRDPQMASNDGWGEICRIVPSGVICLYSAWYFYGLSTFISTSVHIAIKNKQKIVLPDYPPIDLYYWTDKYHELGQVKAIHNGEQIIIYDLEKSVCDAVKFRNKVGMDLCSEILKNYIKRKDRNLDQLMKYAKIMRVSEIISKYLIVML
jgi:predicted transcriptional regulator of viral defense system